MKIEKLKIDRKKLDLNLKFYFLLKYLVKTKLSVAQTHNLIEKTSLSKNSLDLQSFTDGISAKSKKENLALLFEQIESDVDMDLFAFSLKLYAIKDALLDEAQMGALLNLEKLKNLDPLSLDYDKISVQRPYYTRVNSALISLLFFSKLENKETNFMSQDAQDVVNSLSTSAIKLKKAGLEPNQIFMLMFSESVNQSITSNSGSNYEDRILSVLKNIGIPEDKISKTHDITDASTEFDFFFRIDNRSYGIGAKRTLRERYKQFIKTTKKDEKDVNVMIQITLGLDLYEDKAKTILGYGVYLFVADEVYKSRKFLQDLDGVYSVKDLSIATLKSLK